MNQDHSDSESESDNDISDKIEISDGLSSSTLSALLEFMNPPSLDLHLEDTLDSLPAPPSYSGQISTKSVVAAYTPNDVNVIAETFARLQARADAEEIENPKVCKKISRLLTCGKMFTCPLFVGSTISFIRMIMRLQLL